ncbi:hypothetical protein N7493_006206 [Penicillium malachiteum]|uniref:Uncharacterized protein n=1 Tax=Penicillium malachiteum TaxID=1324776 RepID=A0AAD6HKT7_9EURO|nr:hypothetical protein N7493_006206 [Penicillium malachiteum]
MSGILHKAEDALHLHHHDQNKSAEPMRDARQPEIPADKHHHGPHHGDNHHLSQEERDRADFNAARHYDHAKKNSHGPGVGFEE